MTKCLVDDCEKPSHLRRWCTTHYMRWLRHGDPLIDLRDARNRYWTRDDGTPVLTVIDRDGYEHDVFYSPESTELIKARRWHLNDSGYAITFTLNRDETPRRQPLRMHRVVLGLRPGDKKSVDHINGDRIDNRLENLRVVSPAVNAANRSVLSDRGTSRYRGVSYDPQRSLWVAYAKIDYRKHHIGRFGTEEEAATAVAEFRRKHGLPSY